MTETINSISAALTKRDEMNAELPCAPGKRLPRECPRCGSTSDEGCGPGASIDYRFVEDVRAILAAPPYPINP